MKIIVIRPCCMGDVVLATPTLSALRDLYPQAKITLAVGSWSRHVIANHPAIDEIYDTGSRAMPVSTPAGFLRMVSHLRGGGYDVVVSLVRSRVMSAAVWLSGIETRAGLDSQGRGFGYNVRVPVSPDEAEHEADIYLKVARALGAKGEYHANVPILPDDRANVQSMLRNRGVTGGYMVVNPAGGANPGMHMTSKRYPPEKLAQVTNAIAVDLDVQVVVVSGPDDTSIVNDFRAYLDQRPLTFLGELSFGEIAALAGDARLYIGGDTGVTHFAAAAGAPTVMIMGPSDPRRYRPFTPNSIALWQPVALHSGGVAAAQTTFDWDRDGITPDDAIAQILDFMRGHISGGFSMP